MTLGTSDSPRSAERSTGAAPSGLLVKLLGLGIAGSLFLSLVPTLVAGEHWIALGLLIFMAVLLIAVYATSRAVPAKFLLPGLTLLSIFVVYPIVLTFITSTTNLGDGTRGTKAQTIERILETSVTQSENSARFNLTVVAEGSKTSGPFVFYLVNQETGEAFRGDESGVSAVAADVKVSDGFVTSVPNGDILNPGEINQASATILALAVPTEAGAIKPLGIREAFEGVSNLRYDEAADTITDSATNTVYTVQQQGDKEYFADPNGKRISDQSWKASVGAGNYTKLFGDQRVRQDFLRIFIWTFLFAALSVATTFALGLGLAVALNDRRVRGQRVYRSLLLLPYAVPGFISLLVWSGFYNRDFGLINNALNTNIDWLGDPTMAKIALLLTNLWMGFPYMFLVSTGALQAVPSDLKEAASIDGASGWTAFRRITFPLVLVTVAPLLVASFAFNFNNYNAIALLTEGGPFDPANPTAGHTDILISYTMRLAFGTGAQQLGLASAISVVLFVLTGIIAAIQFRSTRALEEVN